MILAELPRTYDFEHVGRLPHLFGERRERCRLAHDSNRGVVEHLEAGGVEDADVITKIDDVAATTIPAFRRALRQGVIRESVVLRIRRNGKDITRIVFLDGIPAPVAPMPREVKR